jgi:hypothetical protein
VAFGISCSAGEKASRLSCDSLQNQTPIGDDNTRCNDIRQFVVLQSKTWRDSIHDDVFHSGNMPLMLPDMRRIHLFRTHWSAKLLFWGICFEKAKIQLLHYELYGDTLFLKCDCFS